MMGIESVKQDCDICEPSGIFLEILRYLTRYPDARDTLEGIAQWWLLEQNIQEQLSKVREVLGELVAHGLLLEYKNTDLRSSYQINKAKYREIAKILGREDAASGLREH